MNPQQRVLVVDDEANMRRVLEIMLARRGYKTFAAADGEEALQLLREQTADLVISDMRMPRVDGIELLRQLRAASNPVPVIMITAHGSIESAVEAMRLGACDYLLRPFDAEALNLAIGRVFATAEVLQRNEYLRGEIERGWGGLVGASRPMQQLRQQVAQVARARTTVLLSGETGSGKEVVARAIHQASDRRDALFVAINCAAIPAEMLESELFGHEKGAFTGALKERIGKFELAQHGTLFLDEITEMPLALQPKLLRVLQENAVERLGGNRSIELDVRVIAATNRDLREALRQQRLREDLYYRLNVFAIALPPLRERREDLPALVEHFLRRHAAGRVPAVSAAALGKLAAYDWPGNVRELSNVIERALILSGGGDIDPEHCTLEAASPAASAGTAETALDLRLEPAVEALERRLIGEALRRGGNSKSRAAQLLQISERSVWYKLKKYGLGGDSG